VFFVSLADSSQMRVSRLRHRAKTPRETKVGPFKRVLTRFTIWWAGHIYTPDPLIYLLYTLCAFNTAEG
jgi:hypothetical protein